MSGDKERSILEQVLKDLEAREARQLHMGEPATEYWEGRRQYPRHTFRVNCVARFLVAGSDQMLVLPGWTRNLSRGGLGLLVKGLCVTGDPVEVELQLPGMPKTYMAGLVQVVRFAGHGYHETGVSLRAVGQVPVFSSEPEAALASLSWLRASRRVPQTP